MNPDDMKRDWKRHDPEPKKCPKCSVAHWEKVLWCGWGFVALILVSMILGGPSQ